ncbi:MAG TPA: hypothetical protein DHI91_01055 [Candidatus Portnoybacteria bacterium]|nr:hypothetical protein [Candidatus Portnoybacteria bacterium]
MDKKLKKVNFVLSVGSVDGVCCSAAVLRNAAEGADIAFCQAFTVDKVDPAAWGERRNILLVDLAVNNRDESMTQDFLRRIKAAGYTIIGVLDEHNADDWRRAFATTELSFDDLAIQPVSQNEGDIKSSGALLLSILGDEADEQTRELCKAADAGDRMDFSTHFGGIVNQAVKSRIMDDSRRVYLAKHFAQNRDADETIRGWIAEYEAVLATHEEIVAARKDLGDGIVRIDAVGKTVDMTTLMGAVYDLGYQVVLTEGEMFDKAAGAKIRQIAFGCKPGLKLDAVATIKAAGVDCSGFAAKANVKPEDEEAALAAIRAALGNQSK